MRVLIGLLMFAILSSVSVQAQRKVEYLDRGLVAVKTSGGVFLSWRSLGTDPDGMGFNVYRGNTKVNGGVITGATNITDAAGSTSSKYSVKPVVNGVELGVGSTANVWGSQVKTLTLRRPAELTMPDGGKCTYAPNDINVGDLDGDGEYELVVKWYPSNAKDNSQEGYTGNCYLDAYKLDGTFLWRIDLGVNIRSGAHYTQHLVADFDSDGKAEVICKTAEGTKDGKGTFLKTGPAANDNDRADYRTSGGWAGFITSGPEYLTIFNGETGAEMQTVTFLVGRGKSNSWGKSDDYTNRVDRFNSTIAYLNGKKPSAIFNRGYYARMTHSAWDWDGKTLKSRWVFNSDNPGNGGAWSQGNHSMMAADVDGDGFDEILTGGACIDHDGTFKWATGFGHGDANHVGDFDPDNPGLEVFSVVEPKSSAPDHFLADANTGRILVGQGSGTDNGRGMCGDIDAAHRGTEIWSAHIGGTRTCKGAEITSNKGSVNFRVYWDGDLQDELLSGNQIDKFDGKGFYRLHTLEGWSCNGSKATPNLSADILGDWREEVILHNGAEKLYISTTTIPTKHKLYTLMHDPVYRNAISWQQSSYNQPPHLGFWLGAGVDKAPKPNIEMVMGMQNENPVVAISSPSNNSSYRFMDDVTFTATASDNDGSIVSVEYYNGVTLIGSSSSVPYSVTLKGVISGVHTITATAIDNMGGRGNATIKINVHGGRYIYEYDNSGNSAWENSNSWTPKMLPTDSDTAIIRAGENKVTSFIGCPVIVEPNGILRMIGFWEIPEITLKGGTLKVNTSNADYGLKANVVVAEASSIMTGENPITQFASEINFSGTKSLTKIGGGTLTLKNAASHFSGNWYVTEGKLKTRAKHAVGTGSIIVSANAVMDIEEVGGIAGCDSLILQNGASVTIDSPTDTVKYLQVNGVAIAKGSYNSANFPQGISGVGTLVVLNGDEITSTLMSKKTPGIILEVFPNPMTVNGGIKYASKFKGDHKLVIYSGTKTENARTIVLEDNSGIVKFSSLGLVESGVYVAVLYHGTKEIGRMSFYY